MDEQQPRTGGINHVNLVVSDLERSQSFYRRALGFEDAGANPDAGLTFLRTPGTDDLLGLQVAGGALDRLAGKPRRPGDSGGVDHIGFAVESEAMLDRLVQAVEAHGGSLLWRSQNEMGEASAFVTDPDGYVLQLG
jgi:catechol 2,3-dioxygenase-like lactoylglutathione lyase family enzyme